MSLPVKVKVTWSKEKVGHLPSGTSYSTAAKFVEDTDSWPSVAWSVVLEFSNGSAKANSFEATARFLVESAPWDRLITGCIFELYEGATHTATATVL